MSIFNKLKKACVKLIKLPAVKIVITAILLCTVGIGVIAALVNPGSGIARGVVVNGIDIGGMSVLEAKSAISGIDILDEQEITIYSKKGKASFKGLDIMLQNDPDKTVERAYRVGRCGSFWENLIELTFTYFNSKNINYVCSYDSEKLSDIIYNFGVSINGEKKNYILEFEGDYVHIQKGVAGQSRNIDVAVNDFNIAVGGGVYDIYVHLEKEEPPIPNTESLYNEIYIAPQDARYEVVGEDVRLVPEVIGRQIDKIEAGTKIDKLKNGEKITLKLVWLKPEITSDMLDDQLFNHILSSYSTTYAMNERGRAANVELAARKINGVILAPGEVFSYNDVVGPRTKAAGFKDAPVFENGETVQGVGGGICQVSSTLYSAVLYADLAITSRKNHSMTVAYVPKGQDATVVYGSIDFKFKNSTEFPIKIVSQAAGGKLTVSIHGTKSQGEKTVKIVNTVIETKEPTVEEKQDKSIEVGEKKVLSKGKTGYTIETIRIVTENGVEVKRENLGKSVYKMVPTKVSIGAKVPEGLAPLPATPTPVPSPVPEEAAGEGEETQEVSGEAAEENTDENTAEESGEVTEGAAEQNPDETPMPTPVYVPVGIPVEEDADDAHVSDNLQDGE